MARATLLELAHHPRIQAVKDCGGDLGKTLAVIAQGRLQVLAGEDLQLFATLAHGGTGAIAASAHLGTAHFVRLLDLLRKGNLAAARVVWGRLVPWIELAFSEPNAAMIKAALALGGELHNELRAPMTRAAGRPSDRLRALCRSLA